MKLKKYLYTLIVLCTMGTFTGCSDWLDYTPKDRETEDQTFSSKQGFYTAVNGVYNRLIDDVMYGKNLTFKTGGVDGCDCDEILKLIADGKIDTTPLITHRFALNDIEKAYDIFENKLENVIKVAITPVQ